MDVIEAIAGRQSVRAYVDKPVSDEVIKKILLTAGRAPSGVNTQPWQVAVLQGAAKERVTTAVLAAYASGQTPTRDYQYYPTEWFEPYKSRRFACGMALYGALNIAREDKERREEIWRWNYHFFFAPVGLMFYIDRHLAQGSWMDYGMFLQNVMLAARGCGLETCPQAAFADYSQIIRETLKLSEDMHIICGMALGYPHWEHPINQYRTEREPLESFVRWYKE